MYLLFRAIEAEQVVSAMREAEATVEANAETMEETFRAPIYNFTLITHGEHEGERAVFFGGFVRKWVHDVVGAIEWTTTQTRGAQDCAFGPFMVFSYHNLAPKTGITALVSFRCGNYVPNSNEKLFQRCVFHTSLRKYTFARLLQAICDRIDEQRNDGATTIAVIDTMFKIRVHGSGIQIQIGSVFEGSLDLGAVNFEVPADGGNNAYVSKVFHLNPHCQINMIQTFNNLV
jgi:hypothetical protein